MKKNKLKALVKSARKNTTETIKAALVATLNEAAQKLGVASKKTTKEIEKSAKNLAKKLSAEVKVDKDALAKAATEAKIVVVAQETIATEPKAAKVAKPKAEKVAG
jgi:hypothetical protein